MLTQRYLPFTGGAENQLASVLRRLPEHGVEAVVITRRHDASPPRDVVEGVPVHRLDVRGPRAWASLSYTTQALSRLRAYRPDVVHAHELLSPATTAVMYRAVTDVPVVAKVLRGGTLGDVAVLRASRLGRLRLARLVRDVDAFIVISREIDAELSTCGVPSERRSFIPNGVDLARFQPASAEEKRQLRSRLNLPSGPLALFAGRLEAEKRIDRLVALWPRVREGVTGAVLVVAGAGGLRETLARASVEGVVLAGPQSNLRDWYAAADLFVLPSEAEGLSNALLEALTMGLSCVATRVGAAPELLADQQGWLVGLDDDQDLVATLILAFQSLPADRGATAREMIARHYSLDNTVRRLAELYRSLTRLRTDAR